MSESLLRLEESTQKASGEPEGFGDIVRTFYEDRWRDMLLGLEQPEPKPQIPVLEEATSNQPAPTESKWAWQVDSPPPTPPTQEKAAPEDSGSNVAGNTLGKAAVAAVLFAGTLFNLAQSSPKTEKPAPKVAVKSPEVSSKLSGQQLTLEVVPVPSQPIPVTKAIETAPHKGLNITGLKEPIITAISKSAAAYNLRADVLLKVAMRENDPTSAGFKPQACNGSDSNHMAGTPSCGPMQFVKSTFDNMSRLAFRANPKAWADIGVTGPSQLDWRSPDQQYRAAAYGLANGMHDNWKATFYPALRDLGLNIAQIHL